MDTDKGMDNSKDKAAMLAKGNPLGPKRRNLPPPPPRGLPKRLSSSMTFSPTNTMT